MNITVERAIQPMPEVHHLIGELNDVLGAAYELHQRRGFSVEQLIEPHVRFFLARLGGIAMGCGGVALFDDYGEVKRMYTRPAVRGLGLGKALLRRIEDEARAVGAPVLRLETGIHQQEAIGLYERTGFRRCGPVWILCDDARPQDRTECLLREGADPRLLQVNTPQIFQEGRCQPGSAV